MNIAEWQRKVRACPKVWAVATLYEGEYTIESVYDTREAAQVHVEYFNSRKPRYGRASVTSFNIQNEELARERFEVPAITSTANRSTGETK